MNDLPRLGVFICTLGVAGAAFGQAQPTTAAPASEATSPGSSPAPAARPSPPAPAPEPASSVSRRTIDSQTVVRLALGSNASLRAVSLETLQARHNVVAEQGRYPYVFGADASYTRSVSPRLSSDDMVTASRNRSYVVGSSISRTFPFGTRAEVRVQGERFENEFTTGTELDPTLGVGYGVSGRLAVTQPLLRGAGTTVGEAELRSARVNEKLSRRLESRVTSELIRDALGAYWELWYAGQVVGIETSALTLARQQEREAQERTAQGALPAADVLTFSNRVAELEEALVSAQLQEEQRSLSLLQLIGTSSEDTRSIAAAQPPAATGAPSKGFVEAALRSSSPELAELESQVELARVRAETAGEAERPRLDLEGYVETQGVSERVPTAAERASRLSWVTTHVGLTFELPLDDSRRQAQKSAAELGVRIAQQNLKAARDRIAAEAARVVTEAAAAQSRLVLAERTLALSERVLEAEQARFELGQSIPIQVQEAEDNVRRARLRVARARVDMGLAQLTVQHLSGDLLARYAGAAGAAGTQP